MEATRQTAAESEITPGEALSIRRLFTTVGRHPFDTVEWEVRDARIGHGDKVAFEQRDVEFPKTWSQNATNIVAQKYFRGQLDSPTRERSVKQMVGRVAGTIADWGRSRGYFATAEDGDTFEAELTYVLLHQMAAFNSPVWFNVGFEESPQCSACQPYDALISTPAGMVAMGELVARRGRRPRGLRRSRGHADRGDEGQRRKAGLPRSAPQRELRRSDGRPCRQGGARAANGARVDAGRRAAGRHAHASASAPGEGRGAGSRHRRRQRLGDLGLGDTIDALKVSEAALAGWLQADGFVGRDDHGTNRSLTVEFQVANDDERAWVEHHLDVVFPDMHRTVRDADTASTPVQRIRLYGKVLRDFVARWGLLAGGTETRVPAQLWAASHEEIAAYLRSTFQADGWVSVRRERGCESARIGLAVIGERWTEDIQILLGTLGIYCRRVHKREKRDDRHDMHEVAISIGSERARFAELVGFVDARKQGLLLESLALRNPTHCPDLREEQIVSIEPLGEMEVYDIQTESGEYLCNNVAVHNCFILSVEDNMESILDWNTKEGMIFRGGSGAGINLSNLRGSMETLAKGGTASGPVSFMRGADSWAGTIKSGGKTRRAAKMVVLDIDHPDIRDFIWCKAREEKKANALRDAGFDMSIDGDGFLSIQYQNANNSVRLTDAFMHAVENDEDWHLIARTTGEPVGEPVRARDLMREIAEAAWQCADPGVQYDTVINQWHTSPNSGRINASNPCCLVGETLVSTSEGPVTIESLWARAVTGETLPQALSFDPRSGELALHDVTNAWLSGMSTEIVEIVTEHGISVRCTPEHRFLLAEGRYVEAQDLAPGVELRATVRQLVAAGETGEWNAVGASQPAGTDRVRSVEHVELSEPVAVYDIEVPGVRNFTVVDPGASAGVVVHNSEYMHVDDSACNLASLNLMKFRRPDGTFDVASFEHAVDIMFLAQEIVVGPSSYPTEQIGVNARAFRQLGLGYANLGAFLMSNGMPYDSDAGRGTAAAITALMTGRAYLGSARVAAAIGPYERYAENRDAHNAVMRMHRDASYAIPDATCSDTALLKAGRGVWDAAVAAGEVHGYRNAQSSTLAPTGTISFLMDCDTTGVEPDFSLVKFKELVGGGQMTIVNQTVPMALRTLGYSDEQIEVIERHIDEHATIVGAPGLAAEHLPVFDVAVGERAISHMGHIKMMGAVQPFISGAISKTVNLPYDATVDDIADAYFQAWRLGVKALAIYRDGSKTAQALRTEAQDLAATGRAVGESYTQEQVDELIGAAMATARAEGAAAAGPKRSRMPRERQSITHKFSIGGHEGYITAGMYEDGTVGEIFLTDIGKEGSTLRGMMNSFATAISIALQYGVPLETLVQKFSYMRFEPEGITQNPEIPFAKSMPDYIMRWLASRFLDTDAQEELGILTPEVRARKAAEDAATSLSSDTAGPTNGGSQPAARPNPTMRTQPATTRAAAEALTGTPPVLPTHRRGLDLGPACSQCGGMMQRTGSCYTCSSCGNNTGCG